MSSDFNVEMWLTSPEIHSSPSLLSAGVTSPPSTLRHSISSKYIFNFNYLNNMQTYVVGFVLRMFLFKNHLIF